MLDVQVRGANDFYALSRRLKNAGQGDLRKEFHRSVRSAAKPLIPKVRQAARDTLPKAGGLNERIARKSYRAQARTGAATAGVRIVGSKVDPRINNEGRVFHPVFGRPGSAVVQMVPAARGYFDDTLASEAPVVQAQITEELRVWADRILRGGF
jgi:hypothetical protein